MAPAVVLPSPPPGKSEGFKRGYVGVDDLPALHTRPSVDVLLGVLNRLVLPPASWEDMESTVDEPRELTKWLTRIIASPLGWVENDALKEFVWEAASRRLAERCGRTAMPSQTRTFRIPVPFSKTVEIILHEPTLTADNLGFKTWASAYLLSKRLSTLGLPAFPRSAKALELGSGTGLVGLAVAAILKMPVLLTDLPQVVPNLRRNADANASSLGGCVDVAVVDWREGVGEAVDEERKYELVLAADPIYSPEHPALLVGMVEKWLKRTGQARAVVEMPVRDGFNMEREDFARRMEAAGLVVKMEGVEGGLDDWGTGEIQCRWGVWGWGYAGIAVV